jgi:hypothetical protein
MASLNITNTERILIMEDICARIGFIGIEVILSEYQTYVAEAADKNQEVDWNKLVNLLCVKGEWTREGAETLVAIVQNYGSFILKNAFALAVATNTEDSQLGL